MHEVARVELEVDPRAALGNDAGGVEELARDAVLAVVVGEEHPWAFVHLANDHPFGTVDDERALFGHQGQFAEVDVLFFDLLDFAFGFAVVAGSFAWGWFPDDQAQGDA